MGFPGLLARRAGATAKNAYAHLAQANVALLKKPKQTIRQF